MATDAKDASGEKAVSPDTKPQPKQPSGTPSAQYSRGLLQFFTGAPQFFRMKRLSGRFTLQRYTGIPDRVN